MVWVGSGEKNKFGGSTPRSYQHCTGQECSLDESLLSVILPYSHFYQ